MVENAWKNKGENGWILCVKMQGKIKVNIGGNLWKNKGFLWMEKQGKINVKIGGNLWKNKGACGCKCMEK